MAWDRAFLLHKHNDRGFTLIETILTLVILAVLLGIVLSAMRIGIRSWDKGGAALGNAAVKRAITSKLAREISSAFPYKDNKDGEETVLFSGGSKALGFVTVSGNGLHGLPWGGAKWVYYSVRDGKLTVREKTVPNVDVKADEGGRLIELDEGVAGITFEYLGNDGWEVSWEANDQKGLPICVRVNILYNDSRKSVKESVPLGLTHERQKGPAA